MRALKNTATTLVLLISAAGLNACGSIATQLSPAYSPPPNVASTMQASLHSHKAAAIGIGVIRDGKLAWSGFYGEQAPGVPATSETLFNVASLAKPVTAEVVMRLVSAGRIMLDEPMSTTWVDADIADDPRHRLLTPRVALSHQTGFPNWRNDGAKKPLAFIADPGSGFTYSGEGYEYLRRFVEKKTGQPFEALANELVFKPNGMNSTTYSERPWMRGRISMPMDRDGAFKSPDLASAGNPNAADNLFVTIADYAAFMNRVVANEGLSAEVARERQRIQVHILSVAACKVPLTEGCPTSTDFNLGWTVYQFGETQILSNSGMDWGEFALVYIDAATRNGMLLFTNGGNGVKVAMDALALFDNDSPVAAFGRAQMRK